MQACASPPGIRSTLPLPDVHSQPYFVVEFPKAVLPGVTDLLVVDKWRKGGDVMGACSTLTRVQAMTKESKSQKLEGQRKLDSSSFS